MKFPKAARIRKRGHYKSLAASCHRGHGTRRSGALLSIDVRLGRAPRPQLGITVSRRFGDAVARNRFKRVIREAFRHLCVAPGLPQDIELNVSPKGTGIPMHRDLMIQEIRQLLTHSRHPAERSKS